MPMALEKSLHGCRPRSSKYFFILSVVETWTNSLLNMSMKARRDLFSTCMIASKDASNLRWSLEKVLLGASTML